MSQSSSAAGADSIAVNAATKTPGNELPVHSFPSRSVTIDSIRAVDVRYDLPEGAGSDAVHTKPQYGYAVTCLRGSRGLEGVGLTYTLGGGTNLICQAIELLAPPLVERDIEELMADFGVVRRSLAEHHQYRWLGPHKGNITQR